MSDRVLFLDIDGVLLPWDVAFDKKTEAFPVKQSEILIDILENIKADVVISSSWRHEFSMPELLSFLQNSGISCNVIGRTRDEERIGLWRFEERCNLIYDWFIEHGLKDDQIIILDDLCMEDEDCGIHLTHRHIRTNSYVGLEKHHIQKAISMF